MRCSIGMYVMLCCSVGSDGGSVGAVIVCVGVVIVCVGGSTGVVIVCVGVVMEAVRACA